MINHNPMRQPAREHASTGLASTPLFRFDGGIFQLKRILPHNTWQSVALLKRAYDSEFGGGASDQNDYFVIA